MTTTKTTAVTKFEVRAKGAGWLISPDSAQWGTYVECFIRDGERYFETNFFDARKRGGGNAIRWGKVAAKALLLARRWVRTGQSPAEPLKKVSAPTGTLRDEKGDLACFGIDIVAVNAEIERLGALVRSLEADLAHARGLRTEDLSVIKHWEQRAKGLEASCFATGERAKAAEMRAKALEAKQLTAEQKYSDEVNRWKSRLTELEGELEDHRLNSLMMQLQMDPLATSDGATSDAANLARERDALLQTMNIREEQTSRIVAAYRAELDTVTRERDEALAALSEARQSAEASKTEPAIMPHFRKPKGAGEWLGCTSTGLLPIRYDFWLQPEGGVLVAYPGWTDAEVSVNQTTWESLVRSHTWYRGELEAAKCAEFSWHAQALGFLDRAEAEKAARAQDLAEAAKVEVKADAAATDTAGVVMFGPRTSTPEGAVSYLGRAGALDVWLLADKRVAVIHTMRITSPPQDDGLERGTWSHNDLERVVRAAGIAPGVVSSEVWQSAVLELLDAAMTKAALARPHPLDRDRGVSR